MSGRHGDGPPANCRSIHRAALYAEVFGAVVGERYEDAAHGFASRVLALDVGSRLELAI